MLEMIKRWNSKIKCFGNEIAVYIVLRSCLARPSGLVEFSVDVLSQAIEKFTPTCHNFFARPLSNFTKGKEAHCCFSGSVPSTCLHDERCTFADTSPQKLIQKEAIFSVQSSRTTAGNM